MYLHSQTAADFIGRSLAKLGVGQNAMYLSTRDRYVLLVALARHVSADLQRTPPAETRPR